MTIHFQKPDQVIAGCCLFSILLLMSACRHEQVPPGEEAESQLQEVSFSRDSTGLMFSYDAQHRVSIIEGRRPGGEKVSLEYGYDGEESWISRWVYTSDIDQYLANSIRIRPYWDGTATEMSISPGLRNPYTYEEKWRIWQSPGAHFPDSVEWDDGAFNTFNFRRLYFGWQATTRTLRIEQRTRVYRQNGWIFPPSDTFYVCTFDESPNPWQHVRLVYGIRDFVTWASHSNLLTFQTVWPDTTWTETFMYDYDAQGRSTRLQYQASGELIEEDWSYRK